MHFSEHVDSTVHSVGKVGVFLGSFGVTCFGE